MAHYLNNQPATDSSKAKFEVLDVNFFEGTNGYICAFKVSMKEQSRGQIQDTVGMMNANVSKDYKTVLRR